MNETTFKIVSFAGLRKFFGDELTVRMELPVSYAEIIAHLKKVKPKASEILDHCRIAVDKEFVVLDSFKTDDNIIYLVPPSSGG